jgi:rhodanese-related sulfurtransferase
MCYAGDLSVNECWDLLENDEDTLLVDVRTKAEWAYVGLPLLEASMPGLVLQEWQAFPDMTVDEGFPTRLQEKLVEAGVGKDAKLCFLCRSGVRSLAAARAMAFIGYQNSFNVSGGFEGDLDKSGHRGIRNGWKAEGLPWQQR